MRQTSTQRRNAQTGIWSPFFYAALVAAALSGTPAPVPADVDPLVLHMLRNLRAVDEIGEGIAVEDFGQVKTAANGLVARAREMKRANLATLGVEAARYEEFIGFLDAQAAAAAEIAAGASAKQAMASSDGLERLLGEACVACHDKFRSGEDKVRPAVLFMTTFLNAWRDINRGVLVEDFSLIRERARDLEAIGRVLAWDRVAAAMFEVKDAKERKAFRDHLELVALEAASIERLASEGKTAEILKATGRMWKNGCVSCHERFRNDD